jgi:hypothetical protein
MGTNLKFKIHPHGWTKRALLAELQFNGTYLVYAELRDGKEIKEDFGQKGCEYTRNELEVVTFYLPLEHGIYPEDFISGSSFSAVEQLLLNKEKHIIELKKRIAEYEKTN